MGEPKQLFSASLAQDAVYKTGLRSFMEYRDLGIEKATHGKFRAHTIRIKKESAGNHGLHTTGLHQHNCLAAQDSSPTWSLEAMTSFRSTPAWRPASAAGVAILAAPHNGATIPVQGRSRASGNPWRKGGRR